MSASSYGGADRHADLAGLGSDDHPQYALRNALVAVTGAYVVAVGVGYVIAGGAGGYVVTVPNATASFGRVVTVKNSGAAGLTVGSVAGQVEGAATLALGVGASVTLASDGTNWWVV